MHNGIYAFRPFTFHAAWNSLPSGHATTAFALAFALIVFFPRWRMILIALAVILAVSRTMVNAHFLSDVLAGGIVGWLTVYMLQRVFVKNGVTLAIEHIYPQNRKNQKISGKQ
jgi:undecaprenyl-diphosphatase